MMPDVSSIRLTNDRRTIPNRPDTVGEVGRPAPSLIQTPGKWPASWVRAGLPGPASHEQTANSDFANSVRPFDGL
jgi:hypothetical protein